MKKLISIKALAGMMIAGSAAVIPFQMTAATPIEECSKELLLAYFPESFVNESLKKFNVPQDKWASITKELNEKDKDVVKIVEEKASKLNPNPLKDPQQRQAAVKIFRETLFEVFSGVLKKNGVTDDSQIQSILDDVQQQKARRFAQCMETQRAKQQDQAPAAQPQASVNLQTPAMQPAPLSPESGKREKVNNAMGNKDHDSSDDGDEDDED